MNTLSLNLRDTAMAGLFLFSFVAAQYIDTFLLGQSGIALYILAAVLIIIAVICLPVLRIPHLPLITLTGLILLCDNPAERAFNEYEPITKELGRWLFLPLQRFTEIPVPISLYEVTALLCGGTALIKILKRYLLGHRDTAWANTGLPIILMCAWGIVIGIFRGGDVISIIFQARMMPYYFFWGIAAWEFIKTEDQLWAVQVTLGLCAMLKALQGITVWYFVWGAGHTVYHRYVIDHYYSDAFMDAAILVIGSLFLPSKKFIAQRLLWRIAPLAIVIFAAYINNRRTAYIGTGFSLFTLPFILFPTFMKAWSKQIAIVVASIVIAGIIFVPYKAMQANGSQIVEDPSALYRVQENLNLLELVKDYPILGVGFGRPMPLVHEMASVSEAYREFALMPHNTLLFIWAFTGPLGLALISVFCQRGIATCMRYAQATMTWVQRSYRSRLLAFLVASQLIRWMFYVYADMGIINPRFAFLVPLGVAAIARLHHANSLAMNKG